MHHLLLLQIGTHLLRVELIYKKNINNFSFTEIKIFHCIIIVIIFIIVNFIIAQIKNRPNFINPIYFISINIYGAKESLIIKATSGQKQAQFDKIIIYTLYSKKSVNNQNNFFVFTNIQFSFLLNITLNFKIKMGETE